MKNTTTTATHESYIAHVRALVVAQAEARGTINADEATRLRHARLLYGAGNGMVRGTCYFQAWENGIGKVDVVEMSASAQESWVQLTGTTVHELAHVAAGHAAGHGPAWKDAATRLGFSKKPEAAGQKYVLSLLRPELREAAHAAAMAMTDGNPAFRTSFMSSGIGAPRPCSAGRGSKGGTSYGTGRLRLWECDCSPKPVKVRVASDDFKATCDVCAAPFHLVVK